MYFKCCVQGCANTRQDAILHKFPVTSENRLYLWLQCLNDDTIDRLSLKNRFVCQKHFEKRFITENSRLLIEAHPTLFTPDEISSGIPHNAENVNAQIDHTYCRKRHYDHTYCKDEPLPSVSTSLTKVKKLPLSDCTNEATPAKQVRKEELISSACTSSFVQSSSTTKSSNQMVTNEEPITAETELKTPTEEMTLKTRPTTPSFKTAPRRRIIERLEKLTPTAQRIYKEYSKARNQVNCIKRARRALNFSKDKGFEKFTANMNPYAKKFLAMQIKLCKKKSKGRRFTMDEKLIALAIKKQSPKCYRFLHHIFILPSTSTLNKMVSKLNIEVGINIRLFNLIKKEVVTWKEHKKYCSIIFDEMALGMGLSYDRKKDKVDGFVELSERKCRFADHVLVFMVRGAIYKWQQPVAFYFCEGATSGPELKKIIAEVVKAVSETGLKPVSLGCDQGTAFQSAIKSFQEDTRRNQLLHNERPDDTITIGGNKIVIIYDPSHLIKGMRNNFLNKNIKSDGKISQWEDIVDVYRTDCKHTDTRLLHKINDEHVIPEKIKKMKVKNCVRVLSKTMAAALSYTAQFSHYVDGTPVSSTINNTAEIVTFLDDLFDSINGSVVSLKKCQGKALKTAVQERSKHHAFWVQAIQKLDKMRFVDSKGQEKYVPTLKNFIITLKSYIKLWQELNKLGVKIMRPRYFNTDPIENFFGQVRAYNYRNNDPTCQSFMNTFKSLTITRVIQFHSDSFNCEDDSSEQLLNLQSLFQEGELSNMPSLSNVTSSHPNTSENIATIIEQARRERLNTHSRAYATGWVIRKMFETLSCSCKKSLTSTADETVHQWISQREFKECKKSKKLSYPSEKAVRLFGSIQTTTNNFLEENAHEIGLKKKIWQKIVSEHSIDLVECIQHQEAVNKYFIDLTIRFGIFNWCNIINKILKGVDIVRLNNENLPKLQKLALQKYSKKLKNKSFNK